MVSAGTLQLDLSTSVNMVLDMIAQARSSGTNESESAPAVSSPPPQPSSSTRPEYAGSTESIGPFTPRGRPTGAPRTPPRGKAAPALAVSKQPGLISNGDNVQILNNWLQAHRGAQRLSWLEARTGPHTWTASARSKTRLHRWFTAKAIVFVVDGTTYGTATGKNKSAARDMAAGIAMQRMEEWGQ
jgi:hypothetical protein